MAAPATNSLGNRIYLQLNDTLTQHTHSHACVSTAHATNFAEALEPHGVRPSTLPLSAQARVLIRHIVPILGITLG